MLDFVTQKKILDSILKNPKNHMCADCDTISPTWASLDFGVFLCSNCSGAHRGLGPTITRVRSANLDQWKTEWLNNMQIGNQQINSYWESDARAYERKPKLGASLQQVGRYVFEKYVKKKFVKNPSSEDPLTAYKNGNYKQKEQSPSKQEPKPAEVKVPIITHTPTPTIQVPQRPKPEINLLEIDFQLKQEIKPVSLPQTQQIQAVVSNEAEDQFTKFTEVGTSFTNQSKDTFISFDTLVNQQKQNSQPQPQLHHSHTAYTGIKPQTMNIHHPYNPALGQHNLVYNSHYQQAYSQQPIYNHYQPQNMGHNYSPAMQPVGMSVGYGMGYMNQGSAGVNISPFWK